jgi:hypothetical protein
LKETGLDGRIILKCIFVKWVEVHGLDISGSEYEEVSKAWVCGRSPAGIAGSNPAGGMDVFLFLSVVCVVR